MFLSLRAAWRRPARMMPMGRVIGMMQPRISRIYTDKA